VSLPYGGTYCFIKAVREAQANEGEGETADNVTVVMVSDGQHE
jgi:hypothetical protein